ncbi:DUF3301 domain-containing protein [Dyella sp.]|jgi:hypothetical protein|uniref:DUF3301 domain-containing protein n=1 Tax=Dyella sp. TaxID=1869338 RepID=UPI002D796BA2|nr:DUF3301 domain-containing protein [Dyella sp.]HET6432128.1 DUF3301 domain-containing protein [Dyella sp.]
MGNLHDLMLLVCLGGIVVTWLQLARAREVAVLEVRRLCERHELQLLDETVGMRALRLRRIDGQRLLERCYGFDVSVAGDDRSHGRLWMAAGRVTEVQLPTSRWFNTVGAVSAPDGPKEAAEPEARLTAPDNVVPLRPRPRLEQRGD